MADVKRFLQTHPHLELTKDKDNRDKVKCKLTNHELPCCVSAIELYTKGKKYQRLVKGIPARSTGQEKYKEFLVPHHKKGSQLYCKLTKKTINNIPHHIEQHVTGKRFTKALAKFEASKRDAEETEDKEDVWVPSDLESDSEMEEEENGESHAEKQSEELNEKESKELNEKEEDVDSGTEELSSDEDEETLAEQPLQINTSKGHPSEQRRTRKNKETGKRKTKEITVEKTPRKKAKIEKSKRPSKVSQKKRSEAMNVKDKGKAPQPKKTSGKRGIKA